jgi:hypothetical protein
MEHGGGFIGSSWNMAMVPVVPHRSWWWLQWFLMEHGVDSSGFSWNMAVAPEVLHGI